MTANTMTMDLSHAMRTVAVNGAYNASRALSKWLRRGVRLNCDGFSQVPIADVASTVCPGDDLVAAVHLPLAGDVEGNLLLVFPQDVGLRLADMMLQMPLGTSQEFGELEESGLCETGNIVGSAYSNSLAKWLKLHIKPEVPSFGCDLSCAILDPLLMEQALHHDEILICKTEFLLDGEKMEWSLLLLPSHSALEKMQQQCKMENMRHEALQTIAINGAFNASRAMSKWLRRGVKIATDGFVQVPLDAVASQWDQERPIVALLSDLSHQMHGNALLAMNEENAAKLVDLLMEQPLGTTGSLGELERSCLEETGNIISGSFVNSWATWLDVMIEPSVPHFVCDLPAAVIESVLTDQALVGDEVFMARTDFLVGEHSLEWLFLLLPAPSSIRLIEMSCT